MSYHGIRSMLKDNKYDASLAGFRVNLTRRQARRTPKLHLDSQLFELVTYLLHKYWSSCQIL